MKRMVELDVLRGFLLLMMVVNHSPSPLRQLTDQPIGFFSTAEAFVFISALLAGLIFQKRREKLGFAAARAATLQRALRIYRAHLITLFVVFAVGSLFLAWVPGIRYILSSSRLGSAPVSATVTRHPADVRDFFAGDTAGVLGCRSRRLEDGACH
jgi:hypothetical protein